MLPLNPESFPSSGNDRPVGVFDSGLGGLTVLSELRKNLPHENFIYLGDTARVPYGSRSTRTVQRYSLEVAHYLMQYHIKMLVIACNTATAQAEHVLKEYLPIPVLGVVRPGVDALLAETKNKKVGVIGTRSTIKSNAYTKTIESSDPQVQVFGKACPLFVPIVEEGWVDKPAASLIIKDYLDPLVQSGIDAVVLGCTHYPLLKNRIQDIYPDLRLVDSSVEIALSVKKELTSLNLLNNQTNQKPYVNILLTDITDTMENQRELFYGLPYDTLAEIHLEEIHSV
jgi:glutamate racemase